VSAGGAGVGASAAQTLPQSVYVEAVADSNITLSGEQTIDGYGPTSSEPILCIGQTDASENGVYTTAAGAWTRIDELDSDEDMTDWIDRQIFVSVGPGGTKYGLGGLGGLRYRIEPASSAATLDTDNLDFEVVPGDYTIYDTTVGVGGVASIDVQNIPPIPRANLVTYAVLRCEQAAVAEGVLAEANGVASGSAYNGGVMQGGAAWYQTTFDDATGMQASAGTALANSFNINEFRIFDYAGTNTHKSGLNNWSEHRSTTANVSVYTGQHGWMWESTAAINRLLYKGSVSDIAEYSRLTLVIEVL